MYLVCNHRLFPVNDIVAPVITLVLARTLVGTAYEKLTFLNLMNDASSMKFSEMPL